MNMAKIVSDSPGHMDEKSLLPPSLRQVYLLFFLSLFFFCSSGENLEISCNVVTKVPIYLERDIRNLRTTKLEEGFLKINPRFRGTAKMVKNSIITILRELQFSAKK